MVVTPNIDHMIKLQKDREFYQIYQEADYRTCDSQIMVFFARLTNRPLKERVSGSDLFPKFCDYYKNDETMTIFLLGGRPGVPELAQKNINQKVGRNMVIGAHSPSFGFEKNEDECEKIIQMINDSGATVLGVGVGAPKQEKWIYKYKDRLKHIKIFFAIGATIDFQAGVIQRSPAWMSDWGIEWIYRIASDPKRLWKRYLIEDMPFFWLLFKEQLGLYRNPFESDANLTGKNVKKQI
jgi:N-acetylglucosaminyldiphosphoundecaprenol N-acetyl-beta-D-mannosaminyltransferase